MAVTVTTHAIAAPWSATNMREAFRQSFVANGIMADWHDTFDAGSNKLAVIERIFDGSKVYGKTYYVFKFTSNKVFVFQCDSWSQVNNQPNGQIHDTFAGGYNFSDATLALGEYALVPGSMGSGDSEGNLGYTTYDMQPSVSAEIKAFKSAIDTDFVFFQVTNGSFKTVFMFPNGPANNLDLDVFYYGGMITAYGSLSPSTAGTVIKFGHLNNGGRRVFPGGNGYGLSDQAYIQQAYSMSHITASYEIVGSIGGFSPSNAFNSSVSSLAKFKLPILNRAILDSNAPATNRYYIHTGVFFNPYEEKPNLPGDFGVYAANGTVNNFTIGDKLIVTAGTEEYTILSRSLSGSSSDTGFAWAAFVARTA